MPLDRDFRLIWLGRSLSELGDFVIPAALALAVVRATGSPGALGLVLACATVPRLLLLPLGGVLGDRWQPRRVALVADLVRVATQLVIGLELISGAFRLADLAVASAVAGAASAFALPTANPLVAATVGTEDRARVNSLLGVSHGIARVAGPALGGTLVLTVGPGWAFVLDAATFAVSAGLLAAVRPHRAASPAPPGAPVAPGRSMPRDLIDGWSELRRHQWFWTSLIGHASWNFAAAVLLTLGPVIAVRELGGEAAWVAVLQAGAIGLLAGALAATRLGGSGSFRLRVNRPVLVANLSLTLYALPLGLLALAAPTVAIVGAYALALAGLGFLNPVWETAVQRHIPADRLARVSAYDILVSLAAMPLGYALAPIAADALGTSAPLGVAALLVLLTTAGTALVPGVRNLRSEPIRPGGAPAARPATAPAGAEAVPAVEAR